MDVEIDYHTKEHWNRVATAKGSRSSDVGSLLTESLADLITEHDPCSILDIGAGNGLLVGKLAERIRGAQIVGIDYSDEAVRIATENSRAGLSRAVQDRVSFTVGSASELPYPDDTFEAVAMLKTAWAVPDLAQALSEAARVLKPNGHIFVQTWGLQEDCVALTLAGEVLGKAINGLRLPESVMSPFFLTPDRLGEFLTNSGMSVVDRRCHQHELAARTPPAYWDQFRTIAGSAYWSLSVQPDVDRAALDADWMLRSERYRDDAGVARLPLSWFLTVGAAR